MAPPNKQCRAHAHTWCTPTHLYTPWRNLPGPFSSQGGIPITAIINTRPTRQMSRKLMVESGTEPTSTLTEDPLAFCEQAMSNLEAGVLISLFEACTENFSNHCMGECACDAERSVK
eukprot:6214469-Pleurochrysis_carterae.AAC.4